MNLGQWLKDGMPFDVPFIIERKFEFDDDPDKLKRDLAFGERLIFRSIDHYKMRCDADSFQLLRLNLPAMLINQDLFEIQTALGPFYIALLGNNFFSIGAKVKMIK